jgi:hypothetical protein
MTFAKKKERTHGRDDRRGAAAIALLMSAALTIATAARVRAEIGPLAFSDDDPTTGAPRMSQSTGGQLAWQADGLSFVFWEEDGETSPDQPSRIWFRHWTLEGGWAARERIDQSRTAGDLEIGGRHPTLQPLADGDLFAAWYDYRHCTAAGSWNDNIEVYGDRRPSGGGFGDVDARLTQSAAAHNGDNSYVPKLARLPDGRVAMTWYDFYWNRDISEIVMRVSDATGTFGLPPAMDDLRLTDATDRAGGDAGRAFTMPQIAADTSGTLHLTWTTGTNDVPASLYYGRYDPDAGEWIDGPRRLAQGVRGHLDPPQLAASPDGAAVWLTYVDRVTHGNDELSLRRRLASASDWGAPIRLTNNAGAQQYAAPAVDAQGRVRIAYVDRTQSRLVYGVYNPVANVFAAVDGNYDSVGGDFIRPAIALDDNDRAYVVWEERTGLATSRLWFWTDAALITGAADWHPYR